MVNKARIRENTIDIVGILKSHDFETKTSAAGNSYIKGKMVVEVPHGDRKMSIPLDYMAMMLTKDGKSNPLAKSVGEIKVGQRLNFRCSFNYYMFWGAQNAAVIENSSLQVRFINQPRADQEDGAVFTYGGFVVEGLKEFNNKDGELVAYTLKVAQPNYKLDGLELVTLHVRPENTAAVNYISQSYTVNTTVKVSGNLHYDVQTREVTEASEFGPSVTKTVQTRVSYNFIESGLPVGDLEVYEQEEIDALLSKHRKDKDEIIKNANTAERAGEFASTTKKQATKASNFELI